MKGGVEWSDRSILKGIKNPSDNRYEIEIRNPELTFLGAAGQPDFGVVCITMHPGESVIELKSLKLYFYQFRNKILSYERLINIIYEDLMSIYKPRSLKVVMQFSPRGGIVSKITIDSSNVASRAV